MLHGPTFLGYTKAFVAAVREAARRRAQGPMPGTIDISTVGDLIDHGFRVWMRCPTHGSRLVDLEKLAAHVGRGASYIKSERRFHLTCALCGARCDHITIEPPSTPKP